MKQIRLVIFLAVALALSACATVTSTGQATLTPAQVAAQVCPSLTTGLGVLQVVSVADPKVSADLLVAVPIVNAVCAAGATVDLASIKTLGDTGVPALLQIIAVSTLPDDQKTVATLAISTAHVILAPIVQQIEAGQSAAVVATTGVTAAQ